MSSQELLQQQPVEPQSDMPSSDAPLPSSPLPLKKLPSEASKHDDSNNTASEMTPKSQKLPVANSAHDGNDTSIASEAPKPSLQTPTNPRLTSLATKQANLEAKLADLQAQRDAMISRAKLPSGLDMPEDWSDEQKSKQALEGANGIIKEHIALLHHYNEMKDIGQGLMGLVADKRGVRVAAIMKDFGMDEKD